MLKKVIDNTVVSNDDDLYCSKCNAKAACRCNARKVTGLVLAKKAIAADPNRTDAVIADELGLDRSTVTKARQLGNFSPTGKRTGRDGKKYPAKRKKRKAKSKAKPKTPDLPIQEHCFECATDAENWQFSLKRFAGDAVSMSALWSHLFGNQWRTFDVPSDVMTLAAEAADAWQKLVKDLKTRRKDK